MHLILIRHAEPDYARDNLTNRGKTEASLLAERIGQWKVDTIYCSPMGRAQATAAPILQALHQRSVTLPWLREFEHYLPNTPAGPQGKAWDIPLETRKENADYYDPVRWKATPELASSDIPFHYDQVSQELDRLLGEYGYFRTANGYAEYSDKENNPATLLCICHMGISCVLLSHLTGVSPFLLWDRIYMAPASVTIVNSEQRIPGISVFRCQSIGDTSHLLQAGLLPSGTGYYRHPIFGY